MLMKPILFFNLFRLHDKDEKIRKIKGKKRRGVVAEIKDEKSIWKYFKNYFIDNYYSLYNL